MRKKNKAENSEIVNQSVSRAIEPKGKKLYQQKWFIVVVVIAVLGLIGAIQTAAYKPDTSELQKQHKLENQVKNMQGEWITDAVRGAEDLGFTVKIIDNDGGSDADVTDTWRPRLDSVSKSFKVVEVRDLDANNLAVTFVTNDGIEDPESE